MRGLRKLTMIGTHFAGRIDLFEQAVKQGEVEQGADTLWYLVENPHSRKTRQGNVDHHIVADETADKKKSETDDEPQLKKLEKRMDGIDNAQGWLALQKSSSICYGDVDDKPATDEAIALLEECDRGHTRSRGSHRQSKRLVA